MRKLLFGILLLSTTISRAQSFDFSCAFEGTITITGSALIGNVYDPNDVDLGTYQKFELTTPGTYTVKLIGPIKTIIKTREITVSGNQTILWKDF